jgi:hypothetical protein
MAGLIQEQMAAGAPAAQEEQMPMDPMGEQPEGMESEGPEPDENDPAFQEAVALAMEALYANGAAKDVANQLKSAPSVIDGVSDIAYEMTSVVDERTDGRVPDELIALLGMKILEEVVEIADAAGLEMSPVDIADAFKQMLLRYLGENGMDTSQLEQAMNSVDPSVFEKAAKGEEVPA